MISLKGYYFFRPLGMYFLKQIRNQFFSTLAAFEVGNTRDTAGTSVAEAPEKKQAQVQLDEKQKARLEDLEQLQKDLEA